MDKSIHTGTRKKTVQHYFAARELQITIALLAVLALLGGAFLQSASAIMSTYLGFTTPVISIFLTIGYITIIAFLSVFFSHRLTGPFKRLEYEIKTISNGALDKRLSIRTKDDLYVRKFVGYANELVEKFENISSDYSNLHSNLSVQIGDIVKKIEKGQYNIEDIKENLKTLQRCLHESREKW